MTSSNESLILISAMTRDRVIGRDNALPWDLPDEYEHFRREVRGHPVVMGRSSYEIFGPDLPDSNLFVVSRSLTSVPGAEVCATVERALERARSRGPRVFSAGGATIYRQTLPLADTMYLSIVKRDYQGDTRFPEFDEREWEITRREDHPEWEFRVYSRRMSPGSA